MHEMALSQKKYNVLEEQFRLQYLNLQKRAIANITNQYVAAIQFSTDELRTLSTKDPVEAARVVDQVIIGTSETIAEIYKRELEGLGQAAADSVILPITLDGNNTGNLPDIIDNRWVLKLLAQPSVIDGLKLSDRIWRSDQRQEIAVTVIKGIRGRKSSSEIAQELTDYSLDGGFKSAYRLAFTETNRAYSTAKVDQVRSWNNSPESDFKILIEQYLSPTHKILDVCDALVGLYDPSGYIPAIPRHPHCQCGQRQVIERPGLKIRDVPTNIETY